MFMVRYVQRPRSLTATRFLRLRHSQPRPFALVLIPPPLIVRPPLVLIPHSALVLIPRFRIRLRRIFTLVPIFPFALVFFRTVLIFFRRRIFSRTGIFFSAPFFYFLLIFLIRLTFVNYGNCINRFSTFNEDIRNGETGATVFYFRAGAFFLVRARF